jgi:transposase
MYNCNEVMQVRKPSIVFHENKKSGVIYAYENRPYWDPEKKQSRAKRKLLGRVDPSTGGIVPTRGRKGKETVDQPTDEKSNSLFDTLQIISKVLIFFRLFMCETLVKRVIGIVLVAVGLPDSRVAELASLSEKSVSTLKKKLEGGELDNMFHVAGGGRKRKLADVEGSILEEISNGTFHSQQQIADMIEEKYGIKVSLPVIGRLLKKTESSD